MTEDVLNWIKKEKLMTEGDTVIVGLSGGADSVALLLVLLELRQRIGYTLLAIHVEHGIRGEESRKFHIHKSQSYHILSGVLHLLRGGSDSHF